MAVWGRAPRERLMLSQYDATINAHGGRARLCACLPLPLCLPDRTRALAPLSSCLPAYLMPRPYTWRANAAKVAGVASRRRYRGVAGRTIAGRRLIATTLYWRRRHSGCSFPRLLPRCRCSVRATSWAAKRFKRGARKHSARFCAARAKTINNARAHLAQRSAGASRTHTARAWPPEHTAPAGGGGGLGGQAWGPSGMCAGEQEKKNRRTPHARAGTAKTFIKQWQPVAAKPYNMSRSRTAA